MRCAANIIPRPILVSANTRIARNVITPRPDRIPYLRLYHNLHATRYRTIRPICSSYSQYSTTTNTGDDNDNHSALNPLPLPKSINPSKGLFLIHLPIPPTHWPSHLDLVFPLLRKTTKFMKERGVVVNCIYDGGGTETEFEEGGKYVARLFTSNGNIEWDGFGEDILRKRDGGFEKEVDRLLGGKGGDGISTTILGTSMERADEILVCTHGSRDCRCSDLGGQLVISLKSEIEARGLGIKVREIAHVGGHKYAANAIVLPSLDMYSNLLPTDARNMLDHISSTSTSIRESSTPFNKHWRGRYGCSESKQEEMWATLNPSASIGESAQTSKGNSEKKKTVQLKFRTFEGDLRTVNANVGDTLLQVARANELPSMEGSCGGNLECSTCHLYIPPNCPIPEPSDPELDMLGYALGYRDDESRLGCQVIVSEEIGGWCEGGGEFGLPRY